MTLSAAIIGHLVGDYLLQNDWMAAGKKRNSLICLLHAAIWAAAVSVFSGLWLWPGWLVLCGTHFVQDRFSLVGWWMCKVSGQREFATGVCAPWSVIVVDNAWHLVVIWAVWQFAA